MSFPTTNILDDFNRADEGPPPSANWTTDPTWSGLAVSGNLCIGTNVAAFNSGIWTANTFGPGCECLAKIGALGGIMTSIILFARYSLAGNGYLAWFIQIGVNAIVSLRRIDAHAETTLSNINIPAFSIGDWIGLQLIGNAIKGFYKPAAGAWTLAGMVNDGTYPGAGYIGLGIDKMQGEADDFGGGTGISSWSKRQCAHVLRC